jgi:copper resistance protein C
MSHRIFLLGSVLLCGMAISGQALAHAHLKSAAPADGATLHTSPSEISLGFTEGLEPAFSTITVTGESGDLTTTLPPVLGNDDATTLSVAPTASLPPDTYTVRWHVLSRDGHPSSGSYQFRVAP